MKTMTNWGNNGWPGVCLSVALQYEQPTDITHLVTLQLFSQREQQEQATTNEMCCLVWQRLLCSVPVKKREEDNLTEQVLKYFHLCDSFIKPSHSLTLWRHSLHCFHDEGTTEHKSKPSLFIEGRKQRIQCGLFFFEETNAAEDN